MTRNSGQTGIDQVLSKVLSPREEGDGWRAFCPAHSDDSPSLMISRGEGGRLLLKCHAGCETDKVLAAMGLGWGAVMGGGSAAPYTGPRRTKAAEAELAFRDEVYRFLVGRLTLSEADRAALRKRGLSDAAIDRGEYRTLRPVQAGGAARDLWAEHGPALLKVPGFLKEDGDEYGAGLTSTSGLLVPVRDPRGRITACQVRTGGRPKYLWLSSPEASCGSPTHVPLGVAVADEVIVTEGPLKADVVWSVTGRPAVAVPGVSAQEPVLGVLNELRPKTVLTAFDMDWQDKEHVREQLVRLEGHLRRAGWPTRRLTWDATYKGIDDAVAAGVSPVVAESEASYSIASPAGVVRTSSGLVTRTLSEVRIEPTRWLVPEYVPSGMISVLAGEGGQGKSSLTLHLASSVTRGQTAFGLTYTPGPPGDVLLCSAEDDPARTTTPRLLAMGADVSRVHIVEGVRDQNGSTSGFDLSQMDKVREELERDPGRKVRLLVIDPVTAYVGGTGVNDHRDSELRSLLRPLAEIAHQHDLAVLLVMHLNKATAMKAVNRIVGSGAYVNAARAVFIVARDRQDPGRRLMLPAKNNLAQSAEGLAFSLVPLPPAEREAVLAAHANHLEEQDRGKLGDQLYRPEWLGRTEVTADEALAPAVKDRHPTKVNRCVTWVRNYLQTSGPCLVTGLEEAGEKAGFTKDNIKEARRVLKAEGLRSRNIGQAGRWYVGFDDPATWNVGNGGESGT